MCKTFNFEFLKSIQKDASEVLKLDEYFHR